MLRPWRGALTAQTGQKSPQSDSFGRLTPLGCWFDPPSALRTPGSAHFGLAPEKVRHGDSFLTSDQRRRRVALLALRHGASHLARARSPRGIAPRFSRARSWQREFGADHSWAVARGAGRPEEVGTFRNLLRDRAKSTLIDSHRVRRRITERGVDPRGPQLRSQELHLSH